MKKTYKQNCWDYKKCERQLGGSKAKTNGVCPTALQKNADKINSGKNGGRICWSIAGTLCGGEPHGDFIKKQTTCLTCEFYKKVRKEEGSNFIMLPPPYED